MAWIRTIREDEWDGELADLYAEAKSDAAANAHNKRADTLQLRVVELEKHRTEITGDLTDAAKSLGDEDYADDFNRRHASVGGGPKP